MKIPARVLAPIVLALLCAGALIGFLWLQLAQSARVIQRGTESGTVSSVQARLQPAIQNTDPLLQGDAAIAHLRQGDLLALQGEWTEAQREYELAVEAGGELPALRSLGESGPRARDGPAR